MDRQDFLAHTGIQLFVLISAILPGILMEGFNVYSEAYLICSAGIVVLAWIAMRRSPEVTTSTSMLSISPSSPVEDMRIDSGDGSDHIAVVHAQEEEATNANTVPRSELVLSEPHDQVISADVEQVIEGLGIRYMADLRMLSEKLNRLHTAQLTAKDEQIAQLNRRVEAAERERDTLAVRLRERARIDARYISDLRALNGKFSWPMEAAEREHDALGETP